MGGKLQARFRGLPRSVRELDRSLALLGMLRGMGWHQTANQGLPVNGKGQAVPWWTTGVAEWLEPRLSKTDRVFEWGSGNSTVWLEQRAAAVITIEHDPAFAADTQKRAPSATVLARTGPEYVSSINQYPAASFGLIVVDGIMRLECSRIAPDYLTPDGLILFDNSDRPFEAPALVELDQLGFLRQDFIGVNNGSHHFTCTSVLTRSPERWFKGHPPKWLGY